MIEVNKTLVLRIGILGASGYMGGELLRVLSAHPKVKIAWATSRKYKNVSDCHTNLYDIDLNFIHPDRITPCDLVFMALPTEQSLLFVQIISTWDCRIIDLGATCRLSDRDVWESVYQRPHTSWQIAQSAIYGINEIHHDAIADSHFVANPGCFSSAAILALAPLMQSTNVDKNRLSVVGLSGTAGIGAEPTRLAHHPEIANNLVPYNVINHRHSAEMEQELGLLTNHPVSVHFTPIYVPINRGILCICSVFIDQSTTLSSLLELYSAYYARHPFISINTKHKEDISCWQYRPYPWVSAVVGTNRCIIGLDIDEPRGRIVIFSVLDNLGKGGAQVAIENMNIMFGLDRTCGLDYHALHP